MMPGWRSAAFRLLPLAMVLGIASPVMAQGQAQETRSAEISAALKAGDGEKAGVLIRAQLTPAFAEADPEVAARLAYQLTEIAGRNGDWSGVYDALNAIAVPLIGKLRGEALDDFIFNLAVSAGMLKKTGEQDRWLDKSVEIAVAEAGAQSSRALTARANAAYSLLSTGRSDDALKRILSTLDAMETYGAADLFFNTAGQAGDAFYQRAGQEAAATIFQRGLGSRLLENDNGPGKGFFWFNTAVYLRDIGSFDDAIKMHYRAMNYLSAYFGSDSREGNSAYEGLAQTLHAAGHLPSAEAAYRYIYKSMLQTQGEDDPDVWRTMNNLAAVLRSLKLPAEALELDKAAYNKRFHAEGGGAPDTVVSAMNMAHDMIDAGRFKDAGEVLAAISRITAQPGYSEAYRAANARWRDYVAYRRGEKTLTRADIETASILETDGMDIEQRLAFFDLYAGEAEKSGLTERAVELRVAALQAARDRFGTSHPFTFEAALALARLREKTDPATAVIDYRDLDATLFDWTRANVTASGSLPAAHAARVLADDMLGSFAAFAQSNPDAARLFAASLDNWKTLSRQAERSLREEAETTTDRRYRDLIDAYFSSFGRFREIVTGSLYTAELAPLQQAMEQAREALNAERQNRGLDEITPWFRSEQAVFAPAVEPEAGDVIVDLAVTRAWPADRGGDPQSYTVRAVVSRHGAADEVVEIGGITTEGQRPLQEAVDELSTRLAKALGKAAGGAKVLYVIPDDFLFQWPIAELRLEDGKRLGETVDVHIATGRQAYRFRSKNNRFGSDKSALLVGGLIYDRAGKVPDLPQTLVEVEEIARLSKAAGARVDLLTGRDATEAKVREASSGTSVLHFATHGFYGADSEASARLFNAGFDLSLASAAEKAEQDSDNIVYAREMLGWNLRRTDLVVIAACDTALGDLGVTSTIRGLPLALSVAGVRRSLLTLDAVPDAATSRFMIRYYEHLTAPGTSYADAFIRTKRDAWAGRIDGVSPDQTYAFVLFEH